MKIQVITPGMERTNTHDYWVRQTMYKAIESLGYEVLKGDSKDLPDIQLICMGMPTSANIRGKYKATWLYSRPERDFPDKEMSVFDQIYTLSSVHQQKFKQKTGKDTKILRVATNKDYKPATEEYKYDVAYMATATDYRLEAVQTLAEAGYKIGLVGSKWVKGSHKPNPYLVAHSNIEIVEKFWPNEQFSDFFNLAPLSIYPMQDAYIENGIVPIRILDVYASSDCLCLAKNNLALKEMFPVLPPTYSFSDELVALAKDHLDNPEKRRLKQIAVRQALTRRWEHVIGDIVQDAKAFWSQ